MNSKINLNKDTIYIPKNTALDSSSKLTNRSESDYSVKNQRKSSDKLTLSKEALAILEKLKARDREVKAHEHAHVAAGGAYVRGGINYQYTRGPDGKRYAVGGEVKIDTSPESTPEETIKKMETVKRAAFAPANPSPQDRQVAAKAEMEKQKAMIELMKQMRSLSDHSPNAKIHSQYPSEDQASDL